MAGSVRPLPIAKPCKIYKLINKKIKIRRLNKQQETPCLQINMNALIHFVSLINPTGKGWDVVSSIRFSSDVEIMINILRMFGKKCLKALIDY